MDKPASGARVQQCIAAGSFSAVARLLSEWPKKELDVLVNEVGEFYEQECKRIDERYEKDCFRPEIFLSKPASAALDKAAKDAKIHYLGIASEICSIAYLYGADDESDAPDAQGGK